MNKFEQVSSDSHQMSQAMGWAKGRGSSCHMFGGGEHRGPVH